MVIPPYIPLINIDLPRIAGGFLPNAFQIVYEPSFRSLVEGVSGKSDVMARSFLGESSVFLSARPSRIPFRHFVSKCVGDCTSALLGSIKNPLASPKSIPPILIGLSVFVGAVFLVHRIYFPHQQAAQLA